MPLRAIIRGENVIAPFLDNEAWEHLKKRVKQDNITVVMPCCGNPAYLRTSKHGFHHFVHKSTGNCTSKPETWQHLKAKHEITLACHAAGYDATTEVEGDGWRADVLATKDNVKIAFEVQWSRQTWEITQQRQQKFTEVGVRGCWFFKSPPEGYRAERNVPLFKLEVTDEDCAIIFNPQSYYDWQEEEHRRIALGDFVMLLLTGKVKFCERITAKPQQSVEIQFINLPCWQCGEFYDVYRVVSTFKTDCGQSLYYHMHLYNPDSDLNFAFHPEIQQALSQYAAENNSVELAKFTKYRRKSSPMPLDAFQCPHCGALLGHKYLMEIYCSDKPDHLQIVMLQMQFRNPPTILEEDEHFGALHGHWCFPENGQFCCE